MTYDLLFIASLLLSPFLVQLSGYLELEETMASISNFTADVATQLTKRLGQRGTTALAAVSAYMLMCRGLRYLRRDRKHAQYPYKTRGDYSKMTAQHAWEITKYVMSLEFPFTTEKALQFALFRTYGIPTISSLLCSTKQLSEIQYAPRRYSDTGILITEFLGHAPTSERANSAIARMNYLHGMYQKSGKISNDDLLYTMSLFVLEVDRWIKNYEWRALTEMELCALGTLWKSIGDAMGITWQDMTHGPDNFRDGLEFVEDLRTWADAYEKRTMVPNDYNHKLAEETIAILLCNTPSILKPVGRQVVIALMDERLRRAMIYDDPSPFYSYLIFSTLKLRKFALRWFVPPRPYSMRFNSVTEQPDPKTGRYYQTVYQAEPWYVKPTFFTRYGLDSWVRWATGRPYPDGKKFKPEGYKIFEVGPQKQEGRGVKDCETTRDRLMDGRRAGCPFGFSASGVNAQLNGHVNGYTKAPEAK